MHNRVKFVFGGVDYDATVTIGHAVAIEAALGKGVVSLIDPLAKFEAPIASALAIIRIALEKEGVRVTDASMFDKCAVEGIIQTQVTALRIVNALFVSADSPKKKGKSGAPLATNTP